jgi:hypothetical protein
VATFVSGLDHPRWPYVLPAETNTSPKPKAVKGIKDG